MITGHFKPFFVTHFQKQRMEQAAALSGADTGRRAHPFPTPHRTHMDHSGHADQQQDASHASIVSKLGLRVPNLAPDVDFVTTPVAANQNMDTAPQPMAADLYEDMDRAQTVASAFEPKKKKYAKEAWPGKKPTMASLLV